MTSQPDFPSRLKAARKAAGYKTAREVIEKHHIPPSTYSQHENGRRAPNDEALRQYSKLFRVDFEWLKTGTGIPFKPSHVSADQKKTLQGELLDLHQISKASSAFIYEELLREILEKLLSLSEKKKISAKKIAAGAAEIYADIVKVESSPDLQRKMIEPLLAAWKRYHLR